MHSLHPSVPTVDFLSLAHFHDIAIDELPLPPPAPSLRLASAVRSSGQRNRTTIQESAPSQILVVTYLEGGSVSTLRFSAAEARTIAASLRMAIARCRQDDQSLGRTASNEPSSPSRAATTIATSASATSASSFQSFASATPPVTSDSNGSPTRRSAQQTVFCGSSPHTLAARSPARSSLSFGARMHGQGTVNPSEMFGSLVLLALLHLNAGSLMTRQTAFALLLQVKRKYFGGWGVARVFCFRRFEVCYPFPSLVFSPP